MHAHTHTLAHACMHAGAPWLALGDEFANKVHGALPEEIDEVRRARRLVRGEGEGMDYG